MYLTFCLNYIIVGQGVGRLREAKLVPTYKHLQNYHTESHESITILAKGPWESKGSQLSFWLERVAFRHATTERKLYQSTQSLRRGVKTKQDPGQPRDLP